MGERKKKPKKIAIIEEEGCTGCEICIEFCPVKDCIVLIDGPDFPGLNPLCVIKDELCIGCALCEKNCPWETIFMVPYEEFESMSVVDK